MSGDIELPAEAFARARRAFPAAAPHALKAALEAAAPHIRAAERERMRLRLIEHYATRRHLCTEMLTGQKCGGITWDDLASPAQPAGADTQPGELCGCRCKRPKGKCMCCDESDLLTGEGP